MLVNIKSIGNEFSVLRAKTYQDNANMIII